MLRVAIQGQLQLNDPLADVLQFALGHDLLPRYVEQFAGKYTEAQLKQILDGARPQITRALEARDAAIKAATEVLNPPRKTTTVDPLPMPRGGGEDAD